MVTIKDIAARLSVSPSTVTRALADSPRISAGMKAKVRAAAQDMGYVADTAAKVMRQRRSTLIGLSIPYVENDFYARIAQAFSETCGARGFQLTLAVSNDDPAIEQRHIQDFAAARCAGIAVVPSPDLSAESAAMLRARNAAQLVRRHPDLPLDCYGIDDHHAFFDATKRLLAAGHQRIGLICAPDTLSSARARRAGYRAALAAAGLSPDPALEQTTQPKAAGTASALQALFAQADPPTALLAAGAGLTEGLLQSAVSWPMARRRSITLVGYNDCAAFGWWGEDGLSAIRLPIDQIAKDLCTRLIRQADNPPETSPSEDFLYRPEFITRGRLKAG